MQMVYKLKKIKKSLRDKLINLIRDTLDNGNSVKVNNIESEIFNLSRKIDETNILLRNLNQTTNLVSKKIANNGIFTGAFIIHNVEAWDSIGGVIKTFSNDPRFIPLVFSINRRFPGEERFIDEDKVHAFLTSENIEHIRLNNDNSYMDLDVIKTLNPDFIFRQSQWDNDYPPGFSTENLRFSKLYYIPYEIMNFLEGVDKNINNSYYHQSCELVFSANAFSKEQDEKQSLIKNHAVTGHPKVEAFMGSKASWPLGNSKNFKVIWGAHHSIFDGWSNFGMFLNSYKTMLDFATEHQEIDIVFSPHPGLVTIMKNISDEEIKNNYTDFITAWNALKNTSYSVFSTYSSMFKAADLLLIDGISWLLEFQLEKKPIIFLERDNHLPFDTNGKLIAEGLNSTKNINEALNLLLEFKNGKVDTHKESQIRNCEQFLILDENKSICQDIVSAIYNNLKQKNNVLN